MSGNDFHMLYELSDLLSKILYVTKIKNIKLFYHTCTIIHFDSTSGVNHVVLKL